MAFSVRQNWLIPVRALQLLLDLIVLGLAAALLANDTFLYEDVYFTLGHASTFGYIVFVTVFTLLCTTYLLVVSLYLADHERLAHPFLVAGLEALLWLFWLCAWAAAAGAVSALCRGITSGWWCSRENALLAFSLIQWFLFCATAGYAVYQAWGEFRGGRGFGMGRSKRGPAPLEDGMAG